MSRLNVNEATDHMKEYMKIVQKHTEHVWRTRHTCSTSSPAASYACAPALKAAGCVHTSLLLSAHHTTSAVLGIWTYGENKISNKSHYVKLML